MKNEFEKEIAKLSKIKMKCAFCKNTNQKSEGGYFKDKFICQDCKNEMVHIVKMIELKLNIYDD